MIYLDNAATTRPNARAVERAAVFLTDSFYNPSARYGGGDEALSAVNAARESLLGCIADPTRFELIFTSCGTEADNQAVFSAAKRGRAVTTAGEHAAVAQSFALLKSRGVTPLYAPLNADGSVNGDALLALVDDGVSLVSVIHVNNETGAVNDIASLARRVKKKNPRCVFMSDGVQAFGKIPVRLTDEIDFYAISAHKIGAPKGCGALIRRKGCGALSPYIVGGGQEGGMRSGTENVFGIAAFAYAAEEKFRTLSKDGARLSGYRELLWSLLDKQSFLRISPGDGSPYILTVSAKNVRGEVIQRILWEKGVAVGTGSACNSKKPYSRVIAACGFGQDVLGGVLRVSFSPETTEEEVRFAALAMNETVLEWKR